MEKKNAFTITRARPEDAAALLDYLKIVGGETDNLSFGAEGVPLAPEEEQAYLRTQVDSPPSIWPSQESGLMALPTSCAAIILRMRPVFSSRMQTCVA